MTLKSIEEKSHTKETSLSISNQDMLKEELNLDKYHSSSKISLGQILLEKGQISIDQLKKAIHIQKENPNKKVGHILVEEGFISDEYLHQALAQQLSIPYVELEQFDFDTKALNLLPIELAETYHAIPLLLQNNILVIALEDPTDTETINTLQFIIGHQLKLATSTKQGINEAIIHAYGSSMHEEDISEFALKADEESKADNIIKTNKNQSPIVNLVQKIIIDGIRVSASDIHIRPDKKYIEVLYRINGIMTSARKLRKEILPTLTAHIKVISNMDVTEHRMPQDGRMTFHLIRPPQDLRISVIPTVKGESIVIRIANPYLALKSLSDLGFSNKDYQTIVDLLKKDHGLFIVTGPTGSGKTTTLYGALTEIKKRNLNIITVEDPVEFQIEGIEQIQINPHIGYHFTHALKQILRHDPDAILIGEIRDIETGKIAIESALTGHIVLSTLHANNAVEAATRFIQLGIEPYLISSSLIGVLAQRLVRKNCKHCLEEEPIEDMLRNKLQLKATDKFYYSKGCQACNYTGFSGRLATYELLSLSPAIRRMIMAGKDVSTIQNIAMKEGMTPMGKNTLLLAYQGIISLQEAYRTGLMH